MHMNKKQFEKLKTELLERGYKTYHQQWHHEDYVIGNGFHKYDNQWEEDRNAYQIILSVYDYSDKKEFWDRLPGIMRDHVGLEVHVDVSRTGGERIEMGFAWHEDTKIEEVEAVAESFYQWVCKTYPKPREEE